jgi:hypothetical protein
MNIDPATRGRRGSGKIKYAIPCIFREEEYFCGKHIGDIVEEQFLFA